MVSRAYGLGAEAERWKLCVWYNYVDCQDGFMRGNFDALSRGPVKA